MAMKARLFVDGEYYNLKSFEYGFVTGSNANGFSSGKTRQVGLSCEIEAIRQELFEEWAFEDFMKKYVEVHIEHTTIGHGKTRVLKCHDTFLLELHTRFSHISEEAMTFSLFMKSGAIEASWSTAAHVEKWSSLPEEGEVTTIEEADLILESAHFEDKNRQQITEVENGKVYLVIKSQNGKGKIVDIDLTDREHDFKYKGIRLEEDILKDVALNGDITRVELEVIDE